MIVGVLTIDLAILESRSLKDKRRVVQSLVKRIRNQFNVSVSEVAYLDTAQRGQLGIAFVGTESRSIHARMDKIVELVRRTAGAILLDYNREFL